MLEFGISDEELSNAAQHASHGVSSVINTVSHGLAVLVEERTGSENVMIPIGFVITPVVTGVLHAIAKELWAIADPGSTPKIIAEDLHATILGILEDQAEKRGPGHRIQELLATQKKGFH